MPKTERILSYLPGTFRVFPRAPVLYAIVDAFGQELLRAENGLAEVMSAHWVDHADRGASEIQDLQRLAALYGLSPRQDEDGEFLETIEEFREHLKRYVRTFLEGTVTVQGILRVTAEVLGLRIADDYQDIDSWWTRKQPLLSTTKLRRDDAAMLVLGQAALTAAGQAAHAAQIKGSINLSGGVDLRQAGYLRLQIDAGAPVTINLLEGITDPTTVDLETQIVPKINSTLSTSVALTAQGFLILQSPTVGPSSYIEVLEGPGDAAGRLLGLAPRSYQGTNAIAAQVTSSVALGPTVDLSQARYLRIAIDGGQAIEIDCAGPNPAATTLDQICQAINQASGAAIATHNNHFLQLTSPTQGASSSLAFQRPAAQDATAQLFGPVSTFYLGQDAQPARFTGETNLSQGVDLSDRANLRLRLNGAAPVTIECGGSVPKKTQLAEIVNAINTALGAPVASSNGETIRLVAPNTGANSTLVIETPESGDATAIILGLSPRQFRGSAATTARLIGTPDLSAGADLRAQAWLQIAIDRGSAIAIDLRTYANQLQAVQLAELKQAINSGLGIEIAGDDGQHLTLTSPTVGSASHLAIIPLQETEHRRFVTRATIIDEAAQVVLGFTTKQASGTPATNAQVVGQVDLRHGTDLRQARFLRLSIDGQSFREIDFATSPQISRPRAALLGEIVAAIAAVVGQDQVSHDGRHLILRSPTPGSQSSIVFAPPQAADAISLLLGATPGIIRGQDASRVSYVSPVDLSNGVSLPAQAAIRLGIDGEPAAVISLSEAEATNKSLTQLVTAINQTLGKPIASQDGRHLILTSTQTGTASQLQFEVPSSPAVDVTAALFGLTPPRLYQGNPAQPAQLKGNRDLSGGVDLRVAHILRLAVDGKPPVIADCTKGIAETERGQVSLERIVSNLNAEIQPAIAAHDGTHLIIRSSAVGLSARLELLSFSDPKSDACRDLLGQVPDVTAGQDAIPATINGEADLLAPVNLAKRRHLRLSLNGDSPIDIDIAGDIPQQTTLSEIIQRINAVVPGLARATKTDRLQLVNPSVAAGSQLFVLPLRYLELIEYPQQPTTLSPQTVQHGTRWAVTNDGVTEAIATLNLTAPQGVVGPTFVNETLGWQLRLLRVLNVGETVSIWHEPQQGLQASTTLSDGLVQSIPLEQIQIGLVQGAQTQVPFSGSRTLTRIDDTTATLQLNNLLAPNLVVLRSGQRPGLIGEQVQVRIAAHLLAANAPTSESVVDGSTVCIQGQVRQTSEGYRLETSEQTVIAQLRAGSGIKLAPYKDRVVRIQGTRHSGQPPLVLVQAIALLFDVSLRYQPTTGTPIEENYLGVTIGERAEEADHSVALAQQVNQRSQLAKSELLEKATILKVPLGRSHWQYLDCHGSRFNAADFTAAHFASDACTERGIFDVSHFSSRGQTVGVLPAVFAATNATADPGVTVVFHWASHRPGSFTVNLPRDLPSRFGGQFNQIRLSQGKNHPELYERAVTEPRTDDHWLVKLITEGLPQAQPPLPASNLIRATEVNTVPLGWEAVKMPFRKPQFLTLGTSDQAARLYLTEEGYNQFIQLEAREVGEWGNAIAVSARSSGPAMYDIAVIYNDSRFENAKVVVRGGDELPPLAQDLLQPGPIGVLQAKAAGIQATVTRDGNQA